MNKQTHIDQLFQKAKTQPVAISFETTKNEFLKQLPANSGKPNSSGNSALFNLKNLIIMFATVGIISSMIFLIYSPSESTTPLKKNHQKEVKQEVQATNSSNEVQFVIKEEEVPKSTKFVWPEMKTKSVLPIQSYRPKDLLTPVMLQQKEKTPLKKTADPSYKFYPKLTPEEIANNHKQKKKMVKALAKFDKKFYSYIPAGSFDYNEMIISIQAFFMQVNEVTNLEYRTFLFDLLIQGKKTEFDIAKPAQENWTLLFGEDMQPMQDQYFSHEAFNEYPVCNVSRAGAEMYCVWLTEAVNATVSQDNKINDVRIPTRVEWYKAASNEGKQLPFPWGTASLKNESNCYLANFDAKTSKTEATQTDTISGDGALLTAKTGTYNPNNYGLYNLSGNVAEMVNNEKIADGKMIWTGFGTAGGSWLNSEAELKINGPDPYDGVVEGHPGIGFRVVITYLRAK